MPAAGKKRRRPRRPWYDELVPEDVQEDPLRAVLDRVLETPQAQSLFEQAQKYIDQLGNAIDPRYQIRAEPAEPPGGHEEPRRPPPRPRPRTNPVVVARGILHFGPSDNLSKALIMERRRAIAALCHPDKGGSNEAMQRVNEAADLLLAQLK